MAAWMSRTLRSGATSPVSRPDNSLVVAIDGPAASGKSSTARLVAERLGARHVDSGSLYRAVTAVRLRDGEDPESWTESSVLASAARVTLQPGETTFHPCIDGALADAEIRGPAVTAVVSLVAKMPHVRAWVNARVREAAVAHDIVVDGRDMGTAVFPGAQVKVWLVALPSERARRRLVQRTGRDPGPAELAAETAELARRDYRDSEQTQPAADATWIDTTGISQVEQVERVVALAREAAR
jgi:cytidylate kinase